MHTWLPSGFGSAQRPSPTFRLIDCACVYCFRAPCMSTGGPSAAVHPALPQVPVTCHVSPPSGLEPGTGGFELPPASMPDAPTQSQVRDLARAQQRTARQVASWQSVGRRVSFMLLNAKHLLTRKSATKIAEFSALLERHGWPDLVTVTELSGASGQSDVHERLGPSIMSRYSVVYTQRSVSLTGGPPNVRGLVGGGVALLVAKCLYASVSEIPIEVSDDDRPYLDGHMRVWRLSPRSSPVPKRGAIRVPIVVTCMYVPPEGPGWGRFRPILFEALQKSDASLCTLQRAQDVFPITMAHINAPWGGCELEVRGSGVPADAVVARDLVAATSSGSCRRGTLSVSEDDRLLLLPLRSAKQTADTSIQGVAFMEAAAESGKLPVAGVMGHMQSTSWVTCLGCTKCVSDRMSCQQMHSVHDCVLVPSRLVLQALARPDGANLLSQRTDRDVWTAVQDHGVTTGHFALLPNSESGQPAAARPPPTAAQRSGSRRYRPPTELFSRMKSLKALAQETDRSLRVSLPESAPLPDSVDALDEALVASLSAATAKTRAADAKPKTVETRRIRVARLKVRLCRAKLDTAIKARPRLHKDRMPAHKRRVELASDALRWAWRVLEGLLQQQQSSELSWRRARAPRAFWQAMSAIERDPGAPDQPVACLLQHHNDADGRRITDDPAVLRERMRLECASVHTLASDSALGPVCCDAIDDALVALHFANRETLDSDQVLSSGGLDPLSAAALSAGDAAAPMSKIDALRGARRDLHDALNRHLVDRSPQLSRGQLIHRLFPGAVTRLNREPSMDELMGIFSRLTDVGPGIDGVCPVVLYCVEEGYTTEALLHLYRRIFATGVQPESWRQHRMLFHYKGKNEDPYCLANYRVLGIDQVLLKIWSLLLVERLDEFIRITKGLSLLQGGFQRQRGCPEQAFTLAETVRFAARTGSVHLTFIDINKAYDRVIHPILWRKCIDRGVSGLFLASLQSIYHEAVATVDINGVLLDPVDLQTGVLQGNPLSPLLFNIYIDDAIREVERRGRARSKPYGLWLPLCAADRSGNLANGSTHDQSNFIPCLFFADDGVFAETDVVAMQELLDIINGELTGCGLTINARKTYRMLVPRLDTSEAQYKILKKLARKVKVHVAGAPIALVDEFMYLGFRVWWRWNWQRAWDSAFSRAHRAFFGASRAGWQHRAGSLDSQLTYAKNKIFCHFAYVAAVAGPGGVATTSQSSAPFLRCERVIDRVLRAIAADTKADVQALRIEAGVWDLRTRIDMLLLRMFCKYASSQVEAPFYRAMYLSCRLSAVEKSLPYLANNAINRIHWQPWGQHLWAAASRLGLQDILPVDLGAQLPPAHDVPRCIVRPRIGTPARTAAPAAAVSAVPAVSISGCLSARGVVVLQADFLGDRRFTTVGVGAVTPRHCDLRLAIPGFPAADYVSDVNCWPLPPGMDPADVFRSWHPVLKVACYSALERRGNAYRQSLARAFLADQVRENTSLRRWASTISASFQQPYWRLPDVESARRLLRLRLDRVGVEDRMRSRPLLSRSFLPRIDDPCERACYLCPAIDGAVGIYWPESLEHVLLTCCCPRLVELRSQARAGLKAIAADPEAIALAADAGVSVPRFDADTELLTALRLCIGIGPSPLVVGDPVPSAPPLLKRAGPQFRYDGAAARRTAEWVHTLVTDWVDIHRNPCRRGLTTAPGARLASLVANHAVSVFKARRFELRSVAAFADRLRDPPDRQG
jgi:hypothetical protein